MKKSEAVLFIMYEMLCSKKMAEDILQVVEKMGMLPPHSDAKLQLAFRGKAKHSREWEDE